MPLTQAEADGLLEMPKVFLDASPLDFSLTQPMDYDRVLRSSDRREEFLLTIERGRRRRMRLKYQTRAKRVVILARLDLNAAPHRNPPEAPYRPGQWIREAHLHLYREGFDDRIAYTLADAPGWADPNASDGIPALEHFMRYCRVMEWPPIQTAL
jgi:hypothetical protein